MALKVSSIPSLPRVNSGLARTLPIATTVLAAVIAILPVQVPGYAALTPAFTLMAVYHWTIYRPDLLPPIGLFAVGLAEDLLSGAPVGVGALVLLLARAAVLRYRGYFINRTFPFVWTGFTLLSAAAMLVLWALHCLVQLTIFDLRATVFRTVLTIAIFPVASFALGRTQRALMDATNDSGRLVGVAVPRETQREKIITRRAALLAGGQAALGAILAARMYQLQVLEKDRYSVLADENRINLRLIAPSRGRIVDRFGVALADNRLNYRVVVVPEQAGHLEATLSALGSLIEISDADRRRVLRDARRKHSFVPLVVRANLSWDEMARIEVAVPELPGVAIEQGMIRHYPYGPTAAHVLGYVAAVSEKELTGDPLLELPDFRIGKSGVEKARDAQLRGIAGTSEVEVNAYGRVVREIATRPGQPGADAVLGLDMAMQDFVARRCATQPSISCVLLDAVTGDVLALVSSPSFDPTLFSTGLSQAAWQELSTDPRHPLTDKAIAGVYPPGSTFKPVVALAALETGVINPDTAFTCPGYLELGDATFHCWQKGGHGTLHLRDAIKKSCDVFFYETSRRTGIDRIAAMARRLGFGAALGLDIPGERSGLIPTRDWKLATTGTSWQQGETLIAGIGQGAVLATPLQIATMAARLATGRAVVPHLLREERVPPGGDPSIPGFATLGLVPRHLALVLDGMSAVVNEQGGTAYAARITDPALAMGGKSGTSQVRRITQAERDHGLRKGTEVPWKERDHALFVAFAPIGAPRYVCAAIVEHGGETGGGGSAVAAPICRDILFEAQRRDPARRVPPPDAVAEGRSPRIPAPVPAPVPSPVAAVPRRG